MKIVWSSFDGRYSDSPRALYEALLGRDGLEHTWLEHPDHAAAFPADARTVPVQGEAAVAALEDADLVVASSHIELTWTKKPGATYLQTWHGTPLKRVHHDVLWAPEGRLDWLQQDVDRWDALLSPNEVSTPRLRGAFGFDGDVWETGYPRNDALQAPDRDAVRRRVRAELGLADDTVAVLYAPTWRDDEGYRSDGSPITMGLDLARLTERLGDGYQLLVRLHNLVTGRWAHEEIDGVTDVSYHPDIRDLYLAADVLVTDYSSVMFDFCVTGKPVVFDAYDLERYRDSTRGFYFDLLPVAPGPVLSTTEEVGDALADLPRLRAEHADAYTAFADTFCRLEDGRSTERVLGRLGL
ncbi:CDP-glycerol glycerophosphotransferase family protein [Solicola sp. PLA-1-18]|uniref:CDP-glycerol glycerophosphotransferase family protein n=1 Tax=Solicola sp. PLA-1-18 TaxID=3380532 RepID=UPI003B790108